MRFVHRCNNHKEDMCQKIMSEKKVVKGGCSVCQKECIEDAPKIVCHIRPNTRSYTKLLKEFILVEVYRSMPLLGNEMDNAPNWEEHIVRYSVVFSKDTELLKRCLAVLKS